MVCLALNSPKQATPDHAGRKSTTGDRQRNIRNGYFRKNRSSMRDTLIDIRCARRCANGKSQTLVPPLPKGDTQQKWSFIPSAQESFLASFSPGRRGPVLLLSFQHISHLATGESVKEALLGCYFILSDQVTDIFDVSNSISLDFCSFAWWV